MAAPSFSAIDYPSLQAIIGTSAQVMVYGFSECYWASLSCLLSEDKTGPIKKVFDCSLGSEESTHYTLEGRKIHQVKKHVHCPCYKSALINMVYENILRKKARLPIIPIVFFIDCDDEFASSSYYPPSAINVINDRTIATFQELRCAYKLCEDPALPAEIREIANQTFKFVRVSRRDESLMYLRALFKAVAKFFGADRVASENLPFFFRQIEAPWQGSGKEVWDREWKLYQAKKSTPEKEEHEVAKKEKGLLWRPQLIAALETTKSSISS